MENQVKRFPFSNRGFVQKIDINQLDDGQYSYLLNMVSQQEGCISPRNGYQDIGVTWDPPTDFPPLIHSMIVTRSTDGSSVYAGEDTNIYRVGPLTGSLGTGWLASSKKIATGVAAAAKRFGFAQFRTDQFNHNGTVYMATGYNDNTGTFRGFLRDDGTYTEARYVGILPPVIPAFAVVGAPDIVNSGNVGTTNTRVTGITISGTPTVAENSIGLGTINLSSNWTIPLSSIAGLQSGMQVLIGSTPLMGIVGNIDATTNTVNIAIPSGGPAPANGDAIVAYRYGSTSITGGGTARIGPFTADLSLSGDAQSGYNSDDFIHFSFYNSSPTTINTATLRLYAGASQEGYYQYTVTLAETAPTEDPLFPINPYWIEYDIPKSAFTANGVGSGDSSWANITTQDVTVKCFQNTDAATFDFGQVFGFGGGGPDSGSSTSFLPYDYVYTYIDPSTGAESNPSQMMNQFNGIIVSHQPVDVIFWGCDNTNENAGVTKIAIYRRGGSYTDGAFRRIGLADNPGLGGGGSPIAGLFLDTIDDLSIINSTQVQFDNDAPVTSDLNQQYNGTMNAGASNYSTITVDGVSGDLRDIITPGTQITIGGGIVNSTFQETCTVWNITATTFTTFLVYGHSTGEQISWSTKAGVAGDVILAAMDCLWMAGNPDNPHILYRSKTAQPESWPVINQQTGNAHQISVSAPSNPIMGLAEFNGEIVCLCSNGIYTVRLDNGQMRGPFKTPANRGLYKKGCWGYVDNGIWFLSYDGIYAWNGAAVQKVTFAVDFIFNDLNVAGVAPYDKFSVTNSLWPELCNIQQKNNEVFFNYVGTDSIFRVLRYNLIFDRWSIDTLFDSKSISTVTVNGFTLPLTSVTCLASDRTTGNLLAARSTSTTVGTIGMLVMYDQVTFTQDGGSTNGGINATPIYYSARSKAYDMGLPFSKKNFTDIAAQINSGQVTTDNVFKCQLYYDYSGSPNATDTFTITPSSTGRQMVPLPLQQVSSASAGKEAITMQWEIFGTSVAQNFWHEFSFGFIPLEDSVKGRVSDWADLGHPYDKRLSSVTIEYDNGNSAVDIYLDTVSGIDGSTQNLAVQTLTLPASVGRSKITLAINADTIAKLVRLRPVVSSAVYSIFDVKFDKDNYPPDRVFFTDYSDYGYEYEKRFYQLYINCDTNGQDVAVDIIGDGSTLQTVTVNGTASNRMQPIPMNPDLIAKLLRLKVSPTAFSGNPNAKFQLFDHRFDFEKLPKPIVLSTPWDDLGYDYVKYAEQIAFDVNTNGYDVPVGVYGDGVLKQTVTVNGTQADRSVNVTLNPGITFQNIRLQVNPGLIPSGGRFQLWEFKPIWRPYDKGAVYHTFDWDDLGHPYDKKISEVTIEFETSATDSNIVIAIDTLTGIDGNTRNNAAITLTLPNSSTGRGFKTFPLPETICKMVRIRSLGNFGGGTQSADFKMWGYKFGTPINYPPDILTFTDWTDNGYSCAKIFRGVGLLIDTGGVDCYVTMDVDGSSVKTWTVNTTTTDRQVYLSPDDDTEINGYMYRLTFSPGIGGKAQIFGQPDWNLTRDACPYVSWDSYPQAYGSVGYTVVKQLWVDYKCAGTITLRMYNADGVLFFTKNLPSHATRTMERFYLPSENGGVINKSKKHRITIEADDANKPFQLYRDGSRSIYLNLSADQRKGYYNSVLWEDLKIPI